MTTIGKRYLDRTRGHDAPRILDARTRAVLNEVLSERRGKALSAYLRAMGRTLAVLVLLGCAPVVAMAQSHHISGQVTDAAGQPLPFATVVLGQGTTGTTTDNSGHFMLAGLAPGAHVLTISSVGYANQSLSVQVPQVDAPLVLHLQQRVVDLPAFTVQNSLTGGSKGARSKAGSAWYITPRELQQFAYTDVSRQLRTVPGVNIQEEDGFGLRPNIGMRGAGAERSSKITVMEDGILIAPAPYASPAAYYFPTTGRMHGMEVVKGSSQVKYGPLTTGGALNLLSTPVPEATDALSSSGMVGLWGGGYGTRNVHAHAGAGMEQLGLMVETFQQAADGFKQLDNGGPTGFNKGDYLAKLQLRSRADATVQHALLLKAGYTNELSNETYLGLTRTDFESTPLRRYAGSQVDRMEVEHDLFTAQYALRLPGGTALTATAYRTNTYRNWYKLDQVVDSSGAKVGIATLLDEAANRPYAFGLVTGSDSPDNALLVKANNRNYQTSGVQLIAQHQLARARATHAFELGARLHSDYMDRYQHTDGYRMHSGTMMLTNAGRPGTESNRVASAEAFAGHATYDLQAGRWGLHPGVRFEHITLSEDNYGTQDPGRAGTNLKHTENTVDVWIPGIGVDHQLHQALQAFAGVHKGFSPPGTNPDTRPEESVNYEAGLRLAHSGWDVQIIGFLNDYSELLGADMAAAGGTGTGDLFNGGSALVQGLECYAAYDPLHRRTDQLRLPISINWTWTDARFGSSFTSTFEGWGQVLEGDRIPYVPIHQLNLRATLQGRRASMGFNATHVAEMPSSTGPTADEPSTRIPAFTVFDVVANYRWGARAEVFATVQNVLDSAYLVSLAPAGARPGLPRMLQGGMRFRF